MELQDHQLAKEVAELVKSRNQIPTAAMKLSDDGSSSLKVFRAVNRTGVAELDGAIATVDKADVQLIQNQVVAPHNAGAQTNYTAGALKTTPKRAHTANKPDMAQHLVRESGNVKERQNLQLVQEVAALAGSNATAVKQNSLFFEGGKAGYQ